MTPPRLSIRAVSPAQESPKSARSRRDHRHRQGFVQAGVPGVHFGVLDVAQGTEKALDASIDIKPRE